MRATPGDFAAAAATPDFSFAERDDPLLVQAGAAREVVEGRAKGRRP